MQAEQTVVLDLDAQADEALEAARKLPHGAARTEAMRKARQLSGNCAAERTLN